MELEKKIMSDTRYQELKGYATNFDKDYRFMMSNEFAEAIEKDEVKQEWKKDIVNLIMKQLEDSVPEVKSNALRNIVRLVKKIDGDQINTLAKNVIEMLRKLPDNDQVSNQDMFSNCLIQIIKEVPDNLIGKLLDLVSILNDVLKERFQQINKGAGAKEMKIIVDNLEQMLEVGIELFKRQIGINDVKRFEIATNLMNILNKYYESNIQKKTSLLLSEIMISLPVNDPKGICIQQILQNLFNIINMKDEKQYLIQIGSYSNLIVRVSNKLDKSQLEVYWKKFKEQILNFLKQGEKLEEEFDDDKVEYVTSVLEKLSEIVASLVQGNPQVTRQFNEDILQIAISLLKFSPGISQEFHNNNDTKDLEEEEDDEDEGSESEDDNDSTWRVRKQALKIMRNLIRFHPDKIQDFFKWVWDKEAKNSSNINFLERLQEKNQGVREEIIKCIESIIKIITIEDTRDKNLDLTDDDDFLSSNVNLTFKRLNSQLVDIPVNVFLKKLLDQISYLLKSKRYSQKIKHETLIFFKNICWNLNKKLLEDQQLWMNVFSILKGLIDQNNKLSNDLKYETLYCFKNLFKRKEQLQIAHIGGHITDVLEFCIKNMDDKFFKISAEALKVISHFLKLLHVNFQNSLNKHQKYYSKIVEKVIVNLDRNDLDISVKQALFQLSSSLMENILSELEIAQINKILGQVSKRIDSENKTQSLIKIFQRLPLEKFQQKIESESAKVLQEIQKKLIQFLAKNDRPLKLIVLQASKKLFSLLSIKPDFCNKEISESFIKNSLYLIHESDIYLAGITLDIYQLIFKNNSSSAHKNELIDKIITLCKSSNMQVPGIKEATILYSLLPILIQQNEALALIQNFQKNSDHSSIHSFSLALATLIQILPQDQQNSQIHSFAKIAFDSQKKEVERQLALYVICEYGKNIDISKNAEIVKGVTDLIQSDNENRDQIKIHAAKCYGGIASKNIESFIGNIKKQIQSSKEGYLTLYTLKEALQNTKKFSSQILEIEENLFTNSSQNDESLRNIVSECIGISYKIDYNQKIKESIIKHLQSKDENTRLVTAQSFKYFCNKGVKVDQVQDTIDALLNVSLLKDSPNVRTAVFKSISMIAHNIPTAIVKKLTRTEFYTALQQSMKIDQSLIKEVDLGAFKNKIDEGENHRSAAFTLLDNLLSIIEKNEIQDCIDLIIPDILTEIKEEMNEDIQIIRLTILNRLSKNYTEKIINHLQYLQEKLFDFLKKLETTKGERALKVLDQCIKSFMILHNVASEESKTEFVTFFNQTILTNDKFKKIVDKFTSNLY